MQFEVGRAYTRPEIHEAVGGGNLQSLFGAQSGRILSCCFKRDENRSAPIELHIRSSVRVLANAEAAARGQQSFPVFEWRAGGDWEYLGKFRALAFSTDPASLESRRKLQQEIAGILFLEADDVGVSEAHRAVAWNEGGLRLVEHLVRERASGVSRSKKETMRKLLGALQCEACSLIATTLPAGVADACFEAHHLSPLGQPAGPRVTRMEDLAILCANCHRMIHALDPTPDVKALRDLLTDASTAKS